jgi:hypothetical protein
LDNKTKKAQDLLRHIDIVLDTHRQFHSFAIKNDRVQLLINTNKVIEGLVETRKMFETHLIKEGVIRKVPVEFIEPVVLKGINGGGHTTSNKHTCTLYVVPPKTTIH